MKTAKTGTKPRNVMQEEFKPDPELSLWFTCQEGSVEKLENLLSRQTFSVDVLAEAFAEACLCGHVDLVSVFLERLPDFDPSIADNSAIRCCGDQPEVLRVLLRDIRVDPSACDSEVLVEACEASNLVSVKILLEDGRVDCNADDGQPLISALYGNMPETCEIVKLLLGKGADPTVRNNAPIKLATSSGCAEIYDLLMNENRISLARGGQFLLRHCWSKEIMNSLVSQKDMDIKAEDERGRTALHQACSAGNWTVALTLINHGLDPLKPDKQGLTSLELVFRVATDWSEIEELITWGVFWPRLRWLWQHPGGLDVKRLIYNRLKSLIFSQDTKLRVKDYVSSSEDDFEDAFDSDQEVAMEEEDYV